MRSVRYRSALALLLVGAHCGATLLLSGCGDDRPAEGKGKDSTAAAKGGAGGGAAADDTSAGASAGAKEFAGGTVVVDSTARFSFRLRPKQGDRFTYRLRTDNETVISGRAMRESSVYNFTIAVTGLNDDGSMTVEMVHDSIRVRRAYDAGLVDSLPRTIFYETRRPDTSVRGTEQFQALIGKRVNITLAPDGDVREVSNVDPVLNALVGANRDKVSPKQWEQLRTVITMQAYSSLVDQLFLREAPDSNVAPGSNWTRTYEVPAMGVPSKNTVRYKLAEVRRADGATFGRVVMTLTTQFLQKKLDNELLSATIDEMKADGSGEAVMRLDNGWPTHKTTTVDMQMKMTGTAKAGPDKGKSSTLAQSVATRLAVDLVAFTAGA